MMQRYLKCPKCNETLKVNREATGKRNKQRGSEYERRVAKLLTKLTGHRWNRTPLSGASVIAGDVYCLDKQYPFTIECKARGDITLFKIFSNPNTLEDIKKDEPLVSPTQILIFKEGLQNFIIAHKDIFPHISLGDFSYCNSYCRIYYKKECYFIFDIDVFKRLRG